MNDIQVVNKEGIEIRIIRDKCISAATCVVYAPETFELDKEGIAIIKSGQWDKLEKIISAAQSCPALAIEIYDNGKKVYPKN